MCGRGVALRVADGIVWRHTGGHDMASFQAPDDDWSDTGCAERVAGAITNLSERLRRTADGDAADDLVARLESALLRGDFAAALALCLGVPRTGPGVHGLFLGVIRSLEKRWTTDTVDFADLAFAFFQIRRLIEMLSEPALPAAPDANAPGSPRILVALAPGERHEFGAQIFASELSLHGWAVDVDLSGDGDSVRQRVSQTRYDAVGLSVGHDGALQGLADFVADLRFQSCHGGICVMLGGTALVEPRVQYKFINADVVAFTAAEAMVWLSAHLAAHRPRLRN